MNKNTIFYPFIYFVTLQEINIIKSSNEIITSIEDLLHEWFTKYT